MKNDFIVKEIITTAQGEMALEEFLKQVLRSRQISLISLLMGSFPSPRKYNLSRSYFELIIQCKCQSDTSIFGSHPGDFRN